MEKESIFMHKGVMPKECYECPCYGHENGVCQITGSWSDGEHDIMLNCPMHSIEDYTKIIAESIITQIYKMQREFLPCYKDDMIIGRLEEQWGVKLPKDKIYIEPYHE